MLCLSLARHKFQNPLTKKIKAKTSYCERLAELLDSLGQSVHSFRNALQLAQESPDSIHTALGEVASGNTDRSARTDQRALRK